MSFRRLGAALLVLTGSLALAGAGWIHGKARLSQALLEHAWSKARQGDHRPQPWPWADTWPVARIESPRLGIELIVLSGASMRNLAFAPAHFHGTALPGHDGNFVVAGHRDTHFRFLSSLGIGDQIVVETPAGAERLYQVTEVAVIEADDRSVLGPTYEDAITLVTCYPFEGIERPTQRYAVRAVERRS